MGAQCGGDCKPEERLSQQQEREQNNHRRAYDPPRPFHSQGHSSLLELIRTPRMLVRMLQRHGGQDWPEMGSGNQLGSSRGQQTLLALQFLLVFHHIQIYSVCVCLAVFLFSR